MLKITWIDDYLFSPNVCHCLRPNLDTNGTGDMTGSIVVNYCIILYFYAGQFGVTKTVCCRQKPILVYEATTVIKFISWIISLKFFTNVTLVHLYNDWLLQPQSEELSLHIMY